MSFSYNEPDSETHIVVQQKTGEIKSLMGKTAQSIVEIGQKLSEVHWKLGYGPFRSWLNHEFQWSHQTAYNFMRVADKFGTCKNFLQVAPSALYLLSAPSVPDEVREEATQKADAGEDEC